MCCSIFIHLYPRKMSGTRLDLQSASHRYCQLVQALPFLQGMASCRNGLSGFCGQAYSPHSTQIHSSFSPLSWRDPRETPGNKLENGKQWKGMERDGKGWKGVQNSAKTGNWDFSKYTSSCFHDIAASLCQVISCNSGQDAKTAKKM